MKSIDSPFASGKLATKVGRNGGGNIKEDIMRGRTDPNILLDTEISIEMANFMEAL